MINAAIFGASGYTGQELTRILLGHPEVKLVAVTSRRFAGQPVTDSVSVVIWLDFVKISKLQHRPR